MSTGWFYVRTIAVFGSIITAIILFVPSLVSSRGSTAGDIVLGVLLTAFALIYVLATWMVAKERAANRDHRNSLGDSHWL